MPADVRVEDTDKREAKPAGFALFYNPFVAGVQMHDVTNMPQFTVQTPSTMQPALKPTLKPVEQNKPTAQFKAQPKVPFSAQSSASRLAMASGVKPSTSTAAQLKATTAVDSSAQPTAPAKTLNPSATPFQQIWPDILAGMPYFNAAQSPYQQSSYLNAGGVPFDLQQSVPQVHIPYVPKRQVQTRQAHAHKSQENHTPQWQPRRQNHGGRRDKPNWKNQSHGTTAYNKHNKFDKPQGQKFKTNIPRGEPRSTTSWGSDRRSVASGSGKSLAATANEFMPGAQKTSQPEPQSQPKQLQQPQQPVKDQDKLTDKPPRGIFPAPDSLKSMWAAQSKLTRSTERSVPASNPWANFSAHISADDSAMRTKAREEVRRLGTGFRPEMKETYKSRRGKEVVTVHTKVGGRGEPEGDSAPKDGGITL